MHEGQILFISDFSDLNGNEKVVSRALSAEEKKEMSLGWQMVCIFVRRTHDLE